MRTASKSRLCCCGLTTICEVTVLTLQHWMPREANIGWPRALQVKIAGCPVYSLSSSHTLCFPPSRPESDCRSWPDVNTHARYTGQVDRSSFRVQHQRVVKLLGLRTCRLAKDCFQLPHFRTMSLSFIVCSCHDDPIARRKQRSGKKM
jgi:hypothetical protein